MSGGIDITERAREFPRGEKMQTPEGEAEIIGYPGRRLVRFKTAAGYVFVGTLMEVQRWKVDLNG